MALGAHASCVLLLRGLSTPEACAPRQGLESHLQCQLDHPRRLTGLDYRLRRGRRHRGAAGLGKHRRTETWRTDGRIARVVEVRMIERVEHLGSEIQLHLFCDVELFSDPQIQIPVTWRLKNISPGSILSGVRNLEPADIFEQ